MAKEKQKEAERECKKLEKDMNEFKTNKDGKLKQLKVYYSLSAILELTDISGRSVAAKGRASHSDRTVEGTTASNANRADGARYGCHTCAPALSNRVQSK